MSRENFDIAAVGQHHVALAAPFLRRRRQLLHGFERRQPGGDVVALDIEQQGQRAQPRGAPVGRVVVLSDQLE
ncbi:hypothetical protein [Bradyrhizobium aeschynomenes]|uniref:hypothetical protein n=1 Tax=Bradyrhizobium aeschynomenes TaxID=2734909 RepID=UPI0015552D3B|nr:hypothetical protein [Bradyrhizobium aeschynomenes]NPV21711.1 hypothetical protein [Bradyrhizobium aeschynomenes]